jgi:ribonuclease HI
LSNIENDSLEWSSVATATYNVNLRATLSGLTTAGVVAFTDGACIKNPGGPAGWCALLWSAADFVDGQVREPAPCYESYGHIPAAKTTTNNRAEISAVLAVLALAPPNLPLKIYSDSEYTIKVAQGIYQMKANPDLWAIYRKLLGFRKQPPTFEWVRGHAGHLHNERADELAGLGAWNSNREAYEKWQNSQAHEAHNRSPRTSGTSNQPRPAKIKLPAGEQSQLQTQVLKLQSYFETVAVDSPRVSEQERKFVQDMARRFQQPKFAPSEKQLNWLKGIMNKHHV